MKTRVGCVDDHPALLMGLQALLGGTADVEFVGTALTVAELLAEVAPDVVLLDLRLDDGSSPAVNVQALMTAGAKVRRLHRGAQFTAVPAGVVGRCAGGGEQG